MEDTHHKDAVDIEMDNNDNIDYNGNDIEEYDGCDEAEMVDFDEENIFRMIQMLLVYVYVSTTTMKITVSTILIGKWMVIVLQVIHI